MEVGFGNRTTNESVLVTEAYHKLVWLTGAQSNVLLNEYDEVSPGCIRDSGLGMKQKAFRTSTPLLPCFLSNNSKLGYSSPKLQLLFLSGHNANHVSFTPRDTWVGTRAGCCGLNSDSKLSGNRFQTTPPAGELAK